MHVDIINTLCPVKTVFQQYFTVQRYKIKTVIFNFNLFTDKKGRKTKRLTSRNRFLPVTIYRRVQLL